MKTTFTWAQIACLHGTSSIDALDFEIPSGVDAVTFLSDDLRTNLAGGFETKDVLLARHLGFEISHEGITFTDDSLRLAHVIDFGMAVSAIDDGDVIADRSATCSASSTARRSGSAATRSAQQSILPARCATSRPAKGSSASPTLN